MALEEGLGICADAVRQQRDAFEPFFFGKADHVVQQKAAVALAAMLRMHDHILQEDDQTTLCSADGEKQIGHPDDLMVGAKNENSAAVWLL